ncbi:MAG TPA: hypothetical protein VHM19_07515, partial [Polyangiales bacterium]|nr:hypothetical protein [Polyangiales bacterium]
MKCAWLSFVLSIAACSLDRAPQGLGTECAADRACIGTRSNGVADNSASTDGGDGQPPVDLFGNPLGPMNEVGGATPNDAETPLTQTDAETPRTQTDAGEADGVATPPTADHGTLYGACSSTADCEQGLACTVSAAQNAQA